MIQDRLKHAILDVPRVYEVGIEFHKPGLGDVRITVMTDYWASNNDIAQKIADNLPTYARTVGDTTGYGYRGGRPVRVRFDRIDV